MFADYEIVFFSCHCIYLGVLKLGYKKKHISIQLLKYCYMLQTCQGVWCGIYSCHPGSMQPPEADLLLVHRVSQQKLWHLHYRGEHCAYTQWPRQQSLKRTQYPLLPSFYWSVLPTSSAEQMASHPTWWNKIEVYDLQIWKLMRQLWGILLLHLLIKQDLTGFYRNDHEIKKNPKGYLIFITMWSSCWLILINRYSFKPRLCLFPYVSVNLRISQFL